jgi:hypothetical protein
MVNGPEDVTPTAASQDPVDRLGVHRLPAPPELSRIRRKVQTILDRRLPDEMASSTPSTSAGSTTRQPGQPEPISDS